MQFVEEFMISTTVAILLWTGSLILMIWESHRPEKDEHQKEDNNES